MKFTLKEMNLIKFSVERAYDNTLLQIGIEDTSYNKVMREQLEALKNLLDKIENQEL